MAVSTVKSVNITNIESNPVEILHRKKGRVKTVIDKIAVATTSIDEVGDKILIGLIPSNAVILDVRILNDALAASGLAANLGLYYSGIGGSQKRNGNTSGTVIDADCFATASDELIAANKVWTSLRFEADDIVDVTKEAWEVAGLSSDPGGLFYLGFDVTTEATTPAAGDIVIRVDYI